MCKSSTYNQQILFETSFWCDVQQEQWIELLKSENNGNDRWRPSLVLTFRPIKIHKWCQKWSLCAIINRKSDIIPVSSTFFFGVKFSMWLLVAILYFDVWARQNTRNDTRKLTHIAENEFLVWNSASNMGYMAQNRKNGIGRWWPSWILIFRLIKIQKNDDRNGLSMPHLLWRGILHGFLWPFT